MTVSAISENAEVADFGRGQVLDISVRRLYDSEVTFRPAQSANAMANGIPRRSRF